MFKMTAAKMFDKFTVSSLAEKCHEAASADEFAAIVAQNYKPLALMDDSAEIAAFEGMEKGYWTQWADA